jgi:hypothetical protein
MKMALIVHKTVRSPAGMHDLNLAYRQTGFIYSVHSPDLLFAQPRIDIPGIFRFPPVRSQRLETAFHSPTTTASFRKPPQRRFLTFLAYPFRTTLNSRLARSAVNSRPRVRS